MRAIEKAGRLPFAACRVLPPSPSRRSPPPEARVAEYRRQVDAARMKASIEKMVGFGTRHTLSSQTDPKRGIGAAVRWAEAEMKKLGLPRRCRPATRSPSCRASRRRPGCATRSPSSAAPSGRTTWSSSPAISTAGSPTRWTAPRTRPAPMTTARARRRCWRRRGCCRSTNSRARSSMRRCRARSRGSTAARSSPITPRRRAGTSSPI